MPRPGDDRSRAVRLEADHGGIVGAEQRADLGGDRREDLGRRHVVRDGRREAPQGVLLVGEHAQLVTRAATRRAPASELAHDVGLLVPDRLGDRPLARREDQLAAAGRHVEARAAQPPARVVGHEPARRRHERAAFGLARDVPLMSRAQPVVPLPQPIGGDGLRRRVRWS